MKLSSLPEEASPVLCDRNLSASQDDVFGVKVPEDAYVLPLSSGLGPLALSWQVTHQEGISFALPLRHTPGLKGEHRVKGSMYCQRRHQLRYQERG